MEEDWLRVPFIRSGGGGGRGGGGARGGGERLRYLSVCKKRPRFVKYDELDAERCHVVTGIPKDVRVEAVQRCVARLMKAAASGGEVTRVVVVPEAADGKGNGQRYCVVEFAHVSSVRAVIDRALRGEPPESECFPDASWGDGPMGMAAWMAAYRAGRRTLEEQQQRADDVAADVERRRAALEAASARAAEEAAGDGWTVVVHRKDKKKVRDAGGTVSRGIRASTAASMAAAEKQRKKAEKEKQDQGLDDFYRFQRREKRRNEVLSLQEKFAEDQRKLEDLRKKRRFRPL